MDAVDPEITESDGGLHRSRDCRVEEGHFADHFVGAEGPDAMFEPFGGGHDFDEVVLGFGGGLVFFKQVSAEFLKFGFRFIGKDEGLGVKAMFSAVGGRVALPSEVTGPRERRPLARDAAMRRGDDLRVST